VGRRTQHIQKALEDAGFKLTRVLRESIGKTGRAIHRALLQRERDPNERADLAGVWEKRKRAELTEALDCNSHDHNACLVSLHMRQVEELEVSLARSETSVGDLHKPLAGQVRLLCPIPGIGPIYTTVVQATIGPGMNRSPTVGRLIYCAGHCPEMHESIGKRRSSRV
jgi:hypothetical protein